MNVKRALNRATKLFSVIKSAPVYVYADVINALVFAVHWQASREIKLKERKAKLLYLKSYGMWN